MGILLYQSVADDLEKKILDGDYSVGDSLPSERTLATQYNVSRNIIREAIKKLAERHLVTNAVGKGTFVTAPTENDMIDMVEHTILASNIPLSEIVDAREDLEFNIGMHIIRQDDTVDLTPLYDIFKKMEKNIKNPPEFLALDTAFHLKLAELSGNTPIKVFYTTLNQLINKSFYYGDYNSEAGRLTAQQEHKAILDALSQRDIDAFCRTIHTHLEFVRLHLTSI